jgi:hypothetical protein
MGDAVGTDAGDIEQLAAVPFQVVCMFFAERPQTICV